MVAILIFIGPVGKSGQFPLHVWLPDAMEGPTPVSALIHAATMVVAGVYLVALAFVLFDALPEAMTVVAWVGAFTAFFAATIALTQREIKRILAYSTVSQLGYMMLALGVGSLTASMFHLMTHAFFKALLFLGAGSVLHALHDKADIFMMGGLRIKMPVTFAAMGIGVLAIAGIPPFAGFFSKDEILAAAAATSTPLYLIATVTAFMTAFYMSRMFFTAFFGEPATLTTIRTNPACHVIALVVLASLSVVGGWLPYQTLRRLGAVRRGASWRHRHYHRGISTILSVVAMSLAWIIYGAKTVPAASLKARFALLYQLSYNKFYIDEIYQWDQPYDRGRMRTDTVLGGSQHRRRHRQRPRQRHQLAGKFLRRGQTASCSTTLWFSLEV
jgi:NADH-quinone oxidoreductase subunit L